MSTAPFRYSDHEWNAVEVHFRETDDVSAVRKALEAVGTRYRLSKTADRLSARRSHDKGRRELAALARRFVALTQKIAPADMGLVRSFDARGRPIVDALEKKVAKAEGEEELAALQSKIGMIAAWIESDGLRLHDKMSNAHQPAKRYVVSQVLEAWRVVLRRPIPKSGGNANGPVSRFLLDAANPILRPGGEIISTGEAARKLIKGYQV